MNIRSNKVFKVQNSNLLIVTYSIFVAIALASPHPWDKQEFLLLTAYNSFFMVIVIAYQWNKSSKVFRKLYQLDSHFSETRHQTYFSGLILDYGEKSEKSRHEFETESIRLTSQLKVALRSLICIGAYLGGLYFFSNQNLMLVLTSLLPAANLGIFLAFSYWGLYIFGLFFSLLFFGLNAQLIYPIGYFIVFIFSSLFIFNLHLLNNWYWQKIHSHKSTMININLKSLMIPMLLFSFSFLGVDFFMEEEKSFLSQIAKIPSASSSKISTQMKIARNISEKIQNQTPFKEAVSPRSDSIWKKLAEVMDKMKLIENLPNPTAQDLEEYTQLLKEQKALTQKLNQAAIASQKTSSGQLSNQAIPLPSGLKNLPQAGIEQVFQHKNLKSGLEKNFPNFSKTPEYQNEMLKLDQLAQKAETENSYNAVEAYSKQKEKILDAASKHQDNFQSFQESMQKELSALPPSEEKQNLLRQLSDLKTEPANNQAYQDKKKDFLSNLENAKEQPVASNNDQTPSKNEQTPADVQNDVIDDELEFLENEMIKNQEKEKSSMAKIIRFALLALALFLILYILNKFMKKDKLLKIEDELTPEQKKEIQQILKNLPARFQDFEQEVDLKYKVFHELAEVLFFAPDTKAPPAMVLATTHEISQDDKLGKLAKNLGVFFNAIHFASKKDFTSKEQRIFRKSYKMMISGLKRQI